MMQTQALRPVATPMSKASKLAAVAALMMGTSLVILSTSMVGVATTRMQTTLSVSLDTLAWILVVYNIGIIITASMSAWLGNLLVLLC